MSLKTVDFPIETASFDEKSDLSADEVEKVVREAGTDLSDGAIQVASLHYVDPQRFGDAFAESMAGSYDVKIVPENVSVAPRVAIDDQTPAFAEEIIPFTRDRDIAEAFADSGYTGDDATGMAEAIGKLLNAPALKAGTVLRVGLEVHGDAAKVVRTSVYDKTTHIVTIALDDRASMCRRRNRSQIPNCSPRSMIRRRRWLCAAICRTSMMAFTAPPIPMACRRS